jgi:4-amino-4-deoxy-L-arabinose transferase-like glycosyltransferase
VSARRPSLPVLALAGLLALALGLRLWSIRHGLPYVYSYDEERNFTPIAVKMIGGSLNPGYFENPPALTYLLSAVFRVRFTVGFPFGSGDLARTLRDNPEAIFLTARVTVALLGTLAVGLVYWAGTRFFGRRTGLVAAALIAFTFLPAFYSKFALNDAVTLVPLTLALVACLGAYERGRPLDFLLAGAALGAATATKYTAGAMVLTLVIAAALRVLDRRDGIRRAVVLLLAAGGVFVAIFLILNPFSLADFHEFRGQLRYQSWASGLGKIGQEHESGWLYYVKTLTWVRLAPGRRRARGRRARAPQRLAPSAPAARLSGRPVRVPRDPGALLRALVHARLSGARRARRVRGGAGGRGAREQGGG